MSENQILKFYTPTCQPCKTYAPLVKDLCDIKEIDLRNINAEEEPELAARYRIRSVPTLVAVDSEGSNLGFLGGVKGRRELTQWMDKYL